MMCWPLLRTINRRKMIDTTLMGSDPTFQTIVFIIAGISIVVLLFTILTI